VVSFARTVDGDLDLSSGGIQLVESLEQRIRGRLRLFRGEWFLDKGRGVPYFQTVLTANPNMGHIKEAFREVVIGTPGVKRLNALRLDFDRETRTLTVRIRVNNTLEITEPLTIGTP
jgi:hypothetical protein